MATKFKLIISCVFAISMFNNYFSQNIIDSLCTNDCNEERFIKMNVKIIIEDRKNKRRIYYYLKDDISDYVDYNAENEVIRFNGKKVKYKPDSLLLTLKFDFENRKFSNLEKEGFTLDTNIQYSLANFNEPLLLGIGKKTNDKKEGKWYYYNQFTYEKYAVVNYKNGLINDDSYFYYEGNLTGVVHFVNNCRHGKFTFFFNNGKLAEFGDNLCNEPYKFIHYKKNGNVLFIYDKSKI